MRWGLIGTGPWARMVHAPSLASHPDAELVSVWGRDASKSGALAREYGARVVETVDDLLDGVDCVSFAVVPDAQAPLAERAIARGRRVLLEKPLATDPAVVRRFANALPDDAHAVVFMTRLFEPVRAEWLRDAIGRGYTGAHVEWVSAALARGSVYAESAWRRGAGIIWDLMPHVLSQVTPVVGQVVDASVEPWLEYDGVRVTLRHEGGAITNVRMTLNAKPEQLAEWIQFDGPTGTTRSPEAALDFVAAHTRAVSAVEARMRHVDDPLVHATTVEGAVAPTAIMSSLVAACDAL